MVNHKIERLSFKEGDNEDAVLEVIDLEQNTGIYTTNLDMTSLAATLVYMNRDPRSFSLEPGSTAHYDDEEFRLTLAYERLHIIPKTLLDRFSPTTQILDISHNRIKDLKFLVRFKDLNSLIADDNLINEETEFPLMPKLKLLWLNHCKVKTLFPWIKKLKHSCPNLKHLCIMGNTAAPSYLNGGTFYEYLQYRLFVISIFPNLVHLDDRAVTKDQREEALRLYQRPLLERLSMPFAHPIISLSQQPGPLALSRSTLKKWRALHEKMSGLFDPPPPVNGRSLLV